MKNNYEYEPLVTVFIPCFNCEKTIIRCIESVLNQKYKNIEIIVIDDGSNDNSINLIESFEDKRIKLYKNECNMGQPFTRNLAFSLSKGKYFSIVDSDDFISKNKIKIQTNIMEKNSDIDVLSSDFLVFYDYKFIRKKVRNKTPNDKIAYRLLFENPFCHSSIMIRMDRYNDINFQYNKDFLTVQDYMLWSDLLINKCKFYNIDKILTNYQVSRSSISSISKNQKKEEREKIIKQIYYRTLMNYNIKLSDYQLSLYYDVFSRNVNNNLSMDNIGDYDIMLKYIFKQLKLNLDNDFLVVRRIMYYKLLNFFSNSKISIKLSTKKILTLLEFNQVSFKIIHIYLYIGFKRLVSSMKNNILN